MDQEAYNGSLNGKLHVVQIVRVAWFRGNGSLDGKPRVVVVARVA